MTMVKGFEKDVKRQDQCHFVKKFCTSGKVLTHVKYDNPIYTEYNASLQVKVQKEWFETISQSFRSIFDK